LTPNSIRLLGPSFFPEGEEVLVDIRVLEFSPSLNWFESEHPFFPPISSSLPQKPFPPDLIPIFLSLCFLSSSIPTG